jgi:hypothetical protein
MSTETALPIVQMPTPEELTQYFAGLTWSEQTSEEVRCLVLGNINGFVSWLRDRTLPVSSLLISPTDSEVEEYLMSLNWTSMKIGDGLLVKSNLLAFAAWLQMKAAEVQPVTRSLPIAPQPYQPWEDFRVDTNLLDVPISAPPCANCEHFRPQRVFSDGQRGQRYEGVRLCHVLKMQNDFGCYRSKEPMPLTVDKEAFLKS